MALRVNVSHQFRTYSLVTSLRFEPVSTVIDIPAEGLKESIFALCNPEGSIAQIPKPFTGCNSEPPSRLVQAFKSLNFRIRTSECLPALLTEGFGGSHSFHENVRISPATVVTPPSYILTSLISVTLSFSFV